MIPVGDTQVRGARFPIVTIVLIAITTLVFLFEITLSTGALENFFQNYAAIPVQILHGRQLYTLLTSMFLHGGWLHLIGNMLFLWIFGDNIEAVMGKAMYLVFYLAGGLAASAAHILFNASSTIPSLGASGAIAAVMGAYIVMFPRSQVRVLVLTGLGAGITRVGALLFLGIWAIMQLFTGIASLGAPTAQTDGVAVWAHVGGFVFGLVIGVLLKGRASSALLESGQA